MYAAASERVDMAEVHEFKTKSEQAKDNLVKEILQSRKAVVLYLRDTEDGTYLGEVMVRCTPSEAVAIVNEAQQSLTQLALQEIARGGQDEG
jgi:hypothetical protein